jgi:enamine deaminase RidA (YjgF/YER057c/UK114 family)
MTVTRNGILAPSGGLPRISTVITHGDTVYTCGVTPDPVGHIKAQTRQVLQRIDRLLHKAGTDKSRLLTAQVWLSGIKLFHDHNSVWNEWVDAEHPPVRACVRAELWHAGMLVEIAVTAASSDRG